MSGQPRRSNQKTHQVISCFYPKQFSLLRYLRTVDSSLRLREKDDTRGYRHLLSSTRVAIPRNQAVTLSQKPRHSQRCTINEIIHRVIETACSKSGSTSVLALGYESLRGNNKCGMVAGTSGIQNSYPNTIVSYLKAAQSWQTLHSRVGDDLMIHLFQNLALFVKMPSRCYLQISGHPIGWLSPLSTNSTCRSKKTSPARTGRGHKSTLLKNTCRAKPTSNSPTKTDVTCHLNSTSQDRVESNNADVSMTDQNPVGEAAPRRKKTRRSGKGWKASWRQTDNTIALQEDSSGETGITGSASCESPTTAPKDQEQNGYVNPQNCSLRDKERRTGITGVCEHSTRLTNQEPTIERAVVFRRGKRKVGDREDEEEEEREENGHCNKRRKIVTDVESKPEDIEAHRDLPGPLGRLCSTSSGPSEDRSSPISPKSTRSKVLKRKHDSNGAKKQADQLASGDQKTVQMAKQHRLCFRAVLRFFRRRLSGKTYRKRTRITSKNRKAKSGKSLRTAPTRGIHTNRKEVKFVKEATPNHMYIPRSQLFFSSIIGQKIPKKHILEVTPVNQRGARKLIRAIFLETPETKEKKMGQPPASNEANVRSKNKKDGKFQVSGTDGPEVLASKKQKPQRLPNRLHSLQSSFVRFLARHKSCRFRLFLRCHCPYESASGAVAGSKKCRKEGTQKKPKAPDSNGAARSTDEKVQQESCSIGSRENLVYRQAVNSYTPYHKVLQFLKSVCRTVVPKELWGSLENERAFFNNLKKFLQLRQYEKYSMSQMIQGIKVSACSWLRPKKTAERHVSVSESLTQKRYLIKFVWWLVVKYLMIILKSFFYITDSCLRRNHIFYYRKPIWRKIHEFGLKSLKGKMLQPLTKQAATAKEVLGCSLLRFVPKEDSIRPIVNMRHRQVNKSGKSVSINMKLQNLFEVMKFEKDRNAAQLGSGVLGVDDVYRALKPFAMKRRSNPNAAPLYFVHVDVSGCYDSIVQQKLYDIMDKVLKEEEYLVRRFTVLTLQDGSAHRSFHKHVSESSDCQTFPEFLRNLASETKLRDAVVVDSVWYLTEDRENLLQLLREHIFSNIVKICDRYYLQTQGIAQGSILSSLLCNYFYGAMEQRYFPEVLGDPNSLLLRWVDDFLLVTPSRPLADKFLAIMHDGIPEYGCFIRTAKTLTNFDTVTPDGVVVKRIGSDDKFPWCGFLVHPATLEVQYDYYRYSESGPISDTITAELNVHPGHALRKKLIFSLRCKSHPLLLDPEINSRETVVTNVYQAFILAAAKFHAFVIEMPNGHQAKDNPAFFARTILDLARFFCSQASRRCRQLSRGQASFRLSEGDVTWLCCQAFQWTLKRKQSRYVKLLDLLRDFIKRLRPPHECLICPLDKLSCKLV